MTRIYQVEWFDRTRNKDRLRSFDRRDEAEEAAIRYSDEHDGSATMFVYESDESDERERCVEAVDYVFGRIAPHEVEETDR